MANPLPVPKYSLLAALSIALVCGAAFGASSSLLPFLKVNAFVLVGALMVLFIAFFNSRRNAWMALLVSPLAGVLAAVAMWMLWFGLEYGFGELQTVLSYGSKGITQTLHRLTSTTSATVRMSGNTFTQSPDEVSMIWLVETILMISAPVLGALVGLWRQTRRPVL